MQKLIDAAKTLGDKEYIQVPVAEGFTSEGLVINVVTVGKGQPTYMTTHQADIVFEHELPELIHICKENGLNLTRRVGQVYKHRALGKTLMENVRRDVTATLNEGKKESVSPGRYLLEGKVIDTAVLSAKHHPEDTGGKPPKSKRDKNK